MLRHKYCLMRTKLNKDGKSTTCAKTYHYTKLGAQIAAKLLPSYKNSYYIAYIPKYYIETDLGIDDSGDYGQWLGFMLETHGDTEKELYDNVSVLIIDQDGGEYDVVGYGYSNKVDNAIDRAIKKELKRA